MLSALISLNTVQYDLVGTVISEKFSLNLCTPDTLLTIYELGPKIARYSVFDCHMSPVGRQMPIETLFLTIFDLHSNTLLCRLSGVLCSK